MGIEEIVKRQRELTEQARAIVDTHRNAGTVPSPEETDQVDALMAEHADLENQKQAILAGQQEQQERQQRAAAAADRVRQAEETQRQPLNMSAAVALANGDRGFGQRPAGQQRSPFQSLGDFGQCVNRAAARGGYVDPRLSAAAPTNYGSTGVDADGGFAVPIEFAQAVQAVMFEEGSILPLTFNIPVAGNSLQIPVDEQSAWGSTGVQAYWTGEGVQGTTSKPALKGKQLSLRKLVCLVPVTDELLQDAGALTAWLVQKMAEAANWRINDALINGTGAGQPLGVLTSGAKTSIAKETNQTADTIVTMNVFKMFSALPAASQGRATWHMAHNAFPQIAGLTIGQVPVWTPQNGGAQNAPAGLLLGRPLAMSQACQPVGDQGDIIAADWKQYVTITKNSGPEQAISMHLYFDYDMTAFRLTFRIDGQPLIQAPITAAKSGGQDTSPFVVLDARS